MPRGETRRKHIQANTQTEQRHALGCPISRSLEMNPMASLLRSYPCVLFFFFLSWQTAPSWFLHDTPVGNALKQGLIV
jgi:hypothetical protein